MFQEVKKSRILLGKAGLIKEEEEDQDDEEVRTLTLSCSHWRLACIYDVYSKSDNLSFFPLHL